MLQEKLDLLLTKYEVGKSAGVAKTADGYTLEIGGKSVRLLPHRFERRFTELRKMLSDGTVTGISAVRCSNISPSDIPLESVIRREIDLARFVTGREVVSVAAFGNGDRAVNVLAVLEGGINAIIEVSNTLPAGGEVIDKHEIIGSRGFVCDRVVDTQVPQQSIYLFGEEGKAYTDVDFELYGLNPEEVSAVRAAMALACDEKLVSEMISEGEKLDGICECVRKSEKSGRKVIIEGGKF